jgi:hypothetical protein
MRYIFAVVLVCAIGAPAAYALPTIGSKALEVSKSDPIVQVAKRKAAKSKSHKSGETGGIHPLVGSGEY